MRRLLAPVFVAPLLLGVAPAWAQSGPSADQIIKSLKPSGNLVGGGTRGIRLAAPSGELSPSQVVPAATAPAAPRTHMAASKPAAVQPATAQAAGPSINLTVNFQNGSADLTPEAIATLDELGRALSSSELSSYRFRIEGHTDTVGSREYNRALSERRAEAVVNYITGKYNVPAGRLEAVGMGEDGPLVPTPPQTPEPRNRRVQVINLGA